MRPASWRGWRLRTPRLTQQGTRADEDAAQARELEEDAERCLAGAESELAQAQTAASDHNARRRALLGAVEEEGRRLARLEAECVGIERERAGLSGTGFEETQRAARAQAVAELAEALAVAERETQAAEARHAEARELETVSREPLADAERAAQRLETEARTLANLLGSDANGPWPRAVDVVSVARGYEAALGAALGDDLDASVDEEAPAHWSLIAPAGEDPHLPPDAEPLAQRVATPPALARRLAQVGVVARADGKRLSALLKPGQRLVSREGRSLALGRLRRCRRSADAGRAPARRKESPRRPRARNRGCAPGGRGSERRSRKPRPQRRGRPRPRRRNGGSACAAARAASDNARDALAEFERARAQTLSRLSARRRGLFAR